MQRTPENTGVFNFVTGDRTGRKRLAERRALVELSIMSHGGPWGGCDECHQHERNTLQPNLDAILEWYKHLNED